MELKITRILAISGSLRAASSNTTLLRAATTLAPENIQITIYDGLGNLPHFNPDFEADQPPLVRDFRAQLKTSDGILISSPEYAHGVPGVLKNALDWVVSSGEFVGKPVALLNASPRATYAQASLKEIITTMDGRIIEDASITLPLLGSGLDEAGIISQNKISHALQSAIAIFARTIENTLSF